MTVTINWIVYQLTTVSFLSVFSYRVYKKVDNLYTPLSRSFSLFYISFLVLSHRKVNLADIYAPISHAYNYLPS